VFIHKSLVTENNSFETDLMFIETDLDLDLLVQMVQM